MPYCSNCNYWMRAQRRKPRATACQNCGQVPLPGPAHIWHDQPPAGQRYEHLGTAIILSCCFMFSLVALAMGPERFWVLLAIAGLGGVIWGWNRSFVTPVLDQRLPHQLFDSMQARMDGILHDAQHLRELLATESADHSTERSMQRWALIQAALQTHEARYRALRHEHWAREVQLWLNQVEGFLAEQLPKLKKQNGATVLTHLEKLVATGEDLQKTGDGFVHLAAAPLQARTILRQCLAKAPEIVERVKDARVLAALDQPASAGPEEFAAGGMWLHWLQNAIPTIEFLPSEFTDDEESLRVRAELRMLRDGLDAPHPESLDQPQAMPSARADPAEA